MVGRGGRRGGALISQARIESERRWGRRFFGVVVAVWLGTVAAFGAIAVNWYLHVSLAQFALMVVFLFSFAFVFTKRLLSLFLPPYELASLDALPRQPKVAILYATMNDVVPECVRAIRPTYPCDVFVLDDSSDPEKRAIVEHLAAEMHFRIMHRPNRKAFKAGAINAWLREHGSAYDYFVLLDADSALPPDWVERALRYAEHPDNADLAIFQGMVNIWNTDRPFPGALAPAHVLSRDEWERKLAGYLGTVVCYGHNVLLRTAPVIEVGGFDERYVSEDFATAIRLANAGYGSAFVPLHSWEAMPENVRGFIKRQNKWTRGSMEFFSFVPPAKIPLSKKIVLLMIPFGHLAYVAIFAAILLAVFGRYSSFNQFLAFGQNLVSAPVEYIWSIPLFRFIILLSAVTSVFTLAKILQVRLRFVDFYRARRAQSEPRGRCDHAPARGPLDDHVPGRPQAALPRDAEGRAAHDDARGPAHGTGHGRADRPPERRPAPHQSGRTVLQPALAGAVLPLAACDPSLLRPSDGAEGLRERRDEGPPRRHAARDERGRAEEPVEVAGPHP